MEITFKPKSHSVDNLILLVCKKLIFKYKLYVSISNVYRLIQKQLTNTCKDDYFKLVTCTKFFFLPTKCDRLIIGN